jgi:hypothetical protein
MKKLLFIVTFMVAAMAVNAQVTHVMVKAADLPKAITENVAKNYAGFNIKEAQKVTENNIISYNVMINKGSMSETLVYDKDGKFLRKMTPAPTAQAKPAVKSAPGKK